jgi:hypothetical protein
MVKLVRGLEQRKKLEVVPLSYTATHSRTDYVSFNILKNVAKELTASPFPFRMQLNKTIDSSQCSQFLIFVRYVHADAIKEKFLFCGSLWKLVKIILPSHTFTGKKWFIIYAQMKLMQCLVIFLILLL